MGLVRTRFYFPELPSVWLYPELSFPALPGWDENHRATVAPSGQVGQNNLSTARGEPGEEIRVEIH